MVYPRKDFEMTSQRQYISKGVYEHSQISDLVSVKEYIFVRHNEKKCLTLRFLNELDYVVNAMEFSVVQMDASKKILKTSKIKYTGLNFVPGTTYVDPALIVVDEYCADFRIVFTEIRSERYKYTVRNGRFTVDYIKADEPIINNATRADYITSFSIRPREFGKPRLSALIATLVACLLVLVCVFDVFFSYNLFPSKDEENETTVGTEVEITTDVDWGGY